MVGYSAGIYVLDMDREEVREEGGNRSGGHVVGAVSRLQIALEYPWCSTTVLTRVCGVYSSGNSGQVEQARTTSHS
jgi:hypothetical protein